MITGSSYGLDHIKFGGVSEALYGLKSSPKFVKHNIPTEIYSVIEQNSPEVTWALQVFPLGSPQFSLQGIYSFMGQLLGKLWGFISGTREQLKDVWV